MIDIDFVELIQNCLAVASTHRDRLFRTQLSIATPLSNGLVRHTKTPIYGRRAPTSAPPSVFIRMSEYQSGRQNSSGHQYSPGQPHASGHQYSPGQPQASGRQYSPGQLDITSAKGFRTELELLQEFQNLHHFLRGSPGVPSTQIPKLMRALSRFPIISITSLAKEARVSKITAKRWLIVLETAGKLQVREFNGMNQYAYKSVLEILDMYVRLSAVP